MHRTSSAISNGGSVLALPHSVNCGRGGQQDWRTKSNCNDFGRWIYLPGSTILAPLRGPATFEMRSVWQHCFWTQTSTAAQRTIYWTKHTSRKVPMGYSPIITRTPLDVDGCWNRLTFRIVQQSLWISQDSGRTLRGIHDTATLRATKRNESLESVAEQEGLPRIVRAKIVAGPRTLVERDSRLHQIPAP